MAKKLDGQRALVTGAGRGIGRSIAVALAKHGAALTLAARSRDELAETAAACLEAGAPRADVAISDLADPRAVDTLAKGVLAAGGCDVLVNNAGMLALGNAADGDPDAWDRMLMLNLSAPMRLTRALSPGMMQRERGTIINIGSVAAVEPMKGTGAYAASKHGLRGWSLSSYERLRESGVKVVLINPGYVLTPMTEHVPGVRKDRMITADDVATAAMLAIETSPMCCPQEITLRLTKRADG